MDKIIDHRIGKRTRRKNYFEYLVKWKGHPEEDTNWVSEENILNKGRQCRSSWTRVHEFLAREV
jgi:hypothetical protein